MADELESAFSAVETVGPLSGTRMATPPEVHSFSFSGEGGREMLRFTAGGTVEPGPGLSADEATREAVRLMRAAFASLRSERERDLEARLERARAALEFYRDSWVKLSPGGAPVPSEALWNDEGVKAAEALVDVAARTPLTEA